MNDTKQKLIIAVIFALILGLIGSMDVEDEKVQQDQYCEMVEKGLWPEYREGEIDCEAL